MISFWWDNNVIMMPLWCIMMLLWCLYDAFMMPLWFRYDAIMMPLWYHYDAMLMPLLCLSDAILMPLWCHYDAIMPLWCHYDARFQTNYRYISLLSRSPPPFPWNAFLVFIACFRLLRYYMVRILIRLFS